MLDTHVWIWLIQGDSRLAPADRQTIEHAALNRSVYVSIISIWEISLLVQRNRIHLHRPIEDWVELSLVDLVQLSALTPAIAIEASRLPEPIHRDPADRILAATARTEDLTLLTQDKRLLAYAKQGHLRAKRI